MDLPHGERQEFPAFADGSTRRLKHGSFVAANPGAVFEAFDLEPSPTVAGSLHPGFNQRDVGRFRVRVDYALAQNLVNGL